jgi:hypothetical protein
VILDRVGDRERLERAVARDYTHFAALHRNPEPSEPRFPLQTTDQLPAYAERFLDRSSGLTKTDILVLRLAPERAAGVSDLDALVRSSAAEDGEREPGGGRGGSGLLSRLRSRLSGHGSRG